MMCPPPVGVECDGSGFRRAGSWGCALLEGEGDVVVGGLGALVLGVDAHKEESSDHQKFHVFFNCERSAEESLGTAGFYT